MNNISTSTKILSIAVVLIVVGYLLMAGPGSTDQQFNPGIFSPRRIVVAPLLCRAGYLLIVVGILRKDCLPRQEKQDEGR
jgi:NhaP-type Na+/H+ or K+/H+ antiporter